jgi:hypothetical protein
MAISNRAVGFLALELWCFFTDDRGGDVRRHQGLENE